MTTTPVLDPLLRARAARIAAEHLTLADRRRLADQRDSWTALARQRACAADQALVDAFECDDLSAVVHAARCYIGAAMARGKARVITRRLHRAVP